MTYTPDRNVYARINHIVATTPPARPRRLIACTLVESDDDTAPRVKGGPTMTQADRAARRARLVALTGDPTAGEVVETVRGLPGYQFNHAAAARYPVVLAALEDGTP